MPKLNSTTFYMELTMSSKYKPELALREHILAGNKTTIIEAYGMTEAAHQMTSNPMPPRHRRSGSVGMFHKKFQFNF